MPVSFLLLGGCYAAIQLIGCLLLADPSHEVCIYQWQSRYQLLHFWLFESFFSFQDLDCKLKLRTINLYTAETTLSLFLFTAVSLSDLSSMSCHELYNKFSLLTIMILWTQSLFAAKGQSWYKMTEDVNYLFDTDKFGWNGVNTFS